jgi:hypothetical protein
MAAQTMWTEDKVHQVELLIEQKLSHSAIGARLGVSSGAITHIVSRHHLSPPREIVAKPKAPVAERTARFRPDQFKRLPASSLRDLRPESSPRAASFAKCEACMWPIGNGMFCNRGKIPKSSYCIRHHRGAYPEKRS